MELSLIHQLIILSIKPKGGFSGSTIISMNFGLAGAVLSELTMAKFIEIKEDKVYVNTGTSSKYEIYEEVLGIMRKKSKSKSVQYWVSTLSYKSGKIKKIAIKELANNGIITPVRKRFLGIFPFTTYVILKSVVKEEYLFQLRQILLENKSPEIPQILLISLLSSCNLLPDLFTDKTERKTAIQNAQKILDNPFSLDTSIAGSIHQAVEKNINNVTASATLTSMN